MAWETRSYPLKQFFSKFIVAILAVVVVISGLHSIQIAKKTYSEPTLFLTATGRAGDTFIFDDFREAYNWMSQNTEENSTILAWADHGYQINQMGKRATIVDGSHKNLNDERMATVSRIMAANEGEARPLLKQLGVDYVMVTFGGMVTWSGDDINKEKGLHIKIIPKSFRAIK